MSANNSLATLRLNRRTVLAGSAAYLAAPYIISSARAAAPSVNIGVIMPLSGPNAQFGINSKNGVELVADEINSAGGIAELGGAKSPNGATFRF
jgi:branched-chain amino acid transport system substrate-binding protein